MPVRKAVIYEGLCVQPAAYPSGRPMLEEGKAYELLQEEGSSTFFISEPGSPAGAYLKATDNREWIFEHLLVDIPWAERSENGDEDKQEAGA